jgi:hypothetical protein
MSKGAINKNGSFSPEESMRLKKCNISCEANESGNDLQCVYKTSVSWYMTTMALV